MLVVAGTAASVGSDHMASAIKKSSTTSAHSSTTTKPHPSNSGIKVNNVNIQRKLKCSTTGEGSGITGFGACSNAAASATDISGSVTGSGSSSRGNSGIEVFNKDDQSGLTCSTGGSSSPISGDGSCSNSASSSTTVSGNVTR
ncbi:MAG: hypothetical protein WCF03_04930 [Nitrososphaeraceae archaeon]